MWVRVWMRACVRRCVRACVGGLMYRKIYQHVWPHHLQFESVIDGNSYNGDSIQNQDWYWPSICEHSLHCISEIITIIAWQCRCILWQIVRTFCWHVHLQYYSQALTFLGNLCDIFDSISVRYGTSATYRVNSSGVCFVSSSVYGHMTIINAAAVVFRFTKYNIQFISILFSYLFRI